MGRRIVPELAEAPFWWRIVPELAEAPFWRIAEDGEKRKSQVEYVYQILRASKRPLHVTEIIEMCRKKYDIELHRESIVSALLKKVNRMDRFIKTDPNTFGLSEYGDLYRSQKQEG